MEVESGGGGGVKGPCLAVITGDEGNRLLKVRNTLMSVEEKIIGKWHFICVLMVPCAEVRALNEEVKRLDGVLLLRNDCYWD